MSTTTTIPIPADVQEYVAANKVEEYLPLVIDLASRHFPAAPVRLEVFEGEVEDQRSVLVCVLARGSVEEVLAAQGAYYRELLAAVPGPLRHHFCLSVDVAP